MSMVTQSALTTELRTVTINVIVHPPSVQPKSVDPTYTVRVLTPDFELPPDPSDLILSASPSVGSVEIARGGDGPSGTTLVYYGADARFLTELKARYERVIEKLSTYRPKKYSLRAAQHEISAVSIIEDIPETSDHEALIYCVRRLISSGNFDDLDGEIDAFDGEFAGMLIRINTLVTSFESASPAAWTKDIDPARGSRRPAVIQSRFRSESIAPSESSSSTKTHASAAGRPVAPSDAPTGGT